MNERPVNKRRVPVAELARGLYVCELDRPWLDTPFLFQGFRIERDSDLAALRRHCEWVYVDVDRSEPRALARVRAMAPAPPVPARQAPGGGVSLPPPSRRERHRDRDNAFGSEPYPDDGRFRELVALARGVRRTSHAYVERVLADVRLGQSIDTRATRRLIRDMVANISENASASLWLTNLKKRDEYTSLHCVNVCVLAIAFGRHLGLPPRQLEVLGLGALLHDIGKMRTPDEVLFKPGPLTPEEFAIMRRHPGEGYEIMRATGRIPAEALAIIRWHHERLSGRGYPDGLAGEDIPLTVMITALADVYDAMTSDRCYRDGMPADRALQVLYEEAPSEYGQELVEEFIRCLGIYPVGSAVELDTGAIGIVVTSDRGARLKPVVVLVRTPGGEPYDKEPVVNLAALGDDPAMPDWAIRRVVNAADYGIDVASVLADTGGDE